MIHRIGAAKCARIGTDVMDEYRKMRWNCNESGCRLDHQPKLGIFDECFFRKSGFSDIDGFVESVGDRFLFIEWKEADKSFNPKEGQGLALARLTALKSINGLHPITLFIVIGNGKNMEVYGMRIIKDGIVGEYLECNLDELKDKIRSWWKEDALADFKTIKEFQDSITKIFGGCLK